MGQSAGPLVLTICLLAAAGCGATQTDTEAGGVSTGGQTNEDGQMEALTDFAERYTAAWNSGEPERVAAFYEEGAALTINGGDPNVGRVAVTAVAKSFMDAFPDMELFFEGLEPSGDRINYHWRFVGTNTGPEGTGKRVDFSGFESWRMGDDGLVADSLGNFDAEEYARQLEHGVDPASDS